MTWADAVLVLWTIYDHPRDAPGHIVVRAHLIVRGQPGPVPYAVGCCYDTLDEARADCQRNGANACLARDPTDDPVIIETWL